MIYVISEEKLFDYMRCPVYYGIKYAPNHIKVKPPVTMAKLLNQVINAFCIKLMNGEVMRLDIMKRKWDMLCSQNPDKMNNEKIREGMGHLYRFYEYAAEKEIRVADIGSTYTIRVQDGKDYYEYKGSLGIILADHNNEPQNLRIDFGTRLTDQADIDQDLKITLDHLGFYQLYGRPLNGTLVHHSRRNRDYYTTRDIPSNKKRCEAIIRNVGKSIRQNIWYPHETPLCPSCTVRDFCPMFGIDI